VRIGFLTYGLDRAPTGIGRYALQLLSALAEMPERPELVVLATEPEDRHGLRERFEYYTVPYSRLLPSLLTVGNAVLGEAARRYRLDLLHDPHGIAPFLWPARGVRRVVTIHDAFAYVYPQTHNRLDNWRFRWHLPRASRKADAVITVSDCSRNDLMRFLDLPPDKVRVTSEGVDPRFSITDTDAQQAVRARYRLPVRYLLYVGGLNARKNLARLFEAYARMRDDVPDVQLVIAGKRQWQTAEMEQAYQRLGLHGQVVFTGYVADTDLPALYGAAEAFVFPSLYEGFGLPPLEAMACGVPVVTSSAASLPEVVGDAALTVDPLDVDELARALTRVLLDAPLRTELRRKGLERARGFRWEIAALQTLHIYREVVGAVAPTAPVGSPVRIGQPHER
jgi:glycosyltransferase involved in cell wall biosynthesis